MLTKHSSFAEYTLYLHLITLFVFPKSNPGGVKNDMLESDLSVGYKYIDSLCTEVNRALFRKIKKKKNCVWGPHGAAEGIPPGG